ncbi:hypothetical protein N7508_000934 [Penicillium antarcticum]|uniref:uncharacterized protein n=1 Tax=Penicillium antarcticum TaxID=416450 RepID=UPI0023971A3E|nr:uncharacterized protein N7508_000934 [Penicillium antarcticum]KAJ5320651.1 hypothetical protein N7508_000934 [Penicillium antarcticum]
MATRLGIFPAPGGLGGSTLRQLLEQVPPNDVVLVARSPEKLCKEKAVGDIIRTAYYGNTPTLDQLFDGISSLNLI